MGWEVYPKGMFEVLTTFRKEYGNPPVFITETGAAYEDVVVDGSIHDSQRISYLRSYLEMALKAKSEGSDLRGLFVWSLVDNFEWAFGFSKRFGLIHVDFESGERIVKDSGWWFSDLAKSRRLPVNVNEGTS
jgi:beta-glucosidase